MSPIQEFGEVAKRLAYNPLGIIALFIVLCYATACLLFGAAVEHLQSSERWPLIWFVVLFPLIVLGVFSWLVAQHHTKLYAPKDFQDSSTYLRTIGIEEQKRRLDEDVAEVVNEGAAAPNPPLQGLGKIRSRYVLAEELVMRELQNEYGVTIARQVRVGRIMGFDGMFVKEGQTFVVEVKMVNSAQISERIWTSLRRVRNEMTHSNLKDARFIIAFVILDVSSKISELTLPSPGITTKGTELGSVRFYSFSELAQKYGLGDEIG